VFSIEGATYIYLPIDNFAKLGFVRLFYVEGTTYIYWPLDDFAKLGFVILF
jgi:hypothetical protein